MSNTAFYRRFIFLALLFCACVQYFSESLNSVALYAILPVSFIISFVHNRGLRTNKYESILLILCAWAFASFFWATYPEAAVVELHQLIGVVMLSFVIAVYAKSSLNIELIYLVFLFLLISCWVYAKFNILPEMSEYDRMNDATLDANTFSYFTSFCTFGIYMLGICVGSQEKQHFYKMLFLLMIPISFVTSLLTASRQILLIQIPFCLALTYLRYFYHQNSPRKLKLFVVFILVFLLLSPIAISLFNNSYLHERFSSSSSTSRRTGSGSRGSTSSRITARSTRIPRTTSFRWRSSAGTTPRVPSWTGSGRERSPQRILDSPRDTK